MVRNHKIIMTNYKDNEVIEFQKKRYHLDKKKHSNGRRGACICDNNSLRFN